MVPAYTDLKLHDITTGLPSCASHPDLIAAHQCDPNVEALDMNEPAGSPGFFAGNSKFITRKLWGIANQHLFGHHGQYTTMREAVEAHSGEALFSRMNFDGLTDYQRDSIIEFLKSLQILPVGTACLVVDEKMECTNVPGGLTPNTTWFKALSFQHAFSVQNAELVAADRVYVPVWNVGAKLRRFAHERSGAGSGSPQAKSRALARDLGCETP